MRIRVTRTRLLIAAALLAVAAVLSAGPLRATYHLHYARAALADRNAPVARRHLEAALQSGYRLAESQFLLARALRLLGEFDDAQVHLREAHRLGYSPETLQREEWLMLAQTGQVREVEQHLSLLLRDPQGDAPAICEAFVEGYFVTYQHRRAYPILAAWEKDFPDDPQPLAFRALHLAFVGDQPGAAQIYRQALERAPRRFDLRARLAAVLMDLHKHDEAIVEYRRGLIDAPGDLTLLIGLGKCAQAQSNSGEARQAFERALRCAPHDLQAQLAMARFDLDDGRPAAALSRLRPLCDKLPTSTEARYALAQALQSLGKSDAAREHFEFVGRAREAHGEVGRLVDGLRDQPDDYEARCRIGVLMLQYGDPAEGETWLRSVLQFRPKHAPAHRALAQYYTDIGNQELAGRHRKLAGDL